LIRLPLSDDDTIDRAAFSEAPFKATMRRHWSSDADERGVLVEHGAEWALRCRDKPDRLLRLNGTPLRLGQRVSLVEPDGSVLPLKVASVR
jgi:hypothetical protein